HDPRQFIFEEDRFLRRKRCWIVERRDCEINRVGIFAVFEKQMGAAACGKRTNPIGVIDLARFALCHDQIVARYRSPLHIRRTCAPPKRNETKTDQPHWPTLQHVSCPAANASTSDLHKTRLAHCNHESTRLNTNLGSACVSRAGCGAPPQRTSSK